VTASTVVVHWRDTSFAAPSAALVFTLSQEGAAVGEGSRPTLETASLVQW